MTGEAASRRGCAGLGQSVTVGRGVVLAQDCSPWLGELVVLLEGAFGGAIEHVVTGCLGGVLDLLLGVRDHHLAALGQIGALDGHELLGPHRHRDRPTAQRGSPRSS